MLAREGISDVPRVVVVRAGGLETDPFRKPFVKGMEELGYHESSNVHFEFRYFADDRALPSVMADIVASERSVIIAGGTRGPPATHAEQSATRDIAIVMASVADPVAAGLVSTLAHPGGNTTGLALFGPDLMVKRLELLKAALPDVSRVALLRKPENPSHLLILQAISAAAPSLDLQMRSCDTESIGALENAFAEMATWQADAVLVLDEPLFIAVRTDIAAEAMKQRLLCVCGFKEMANSGCLVSYSVHSRERWRLTSARTQTEDTGSRLSLARMASAGLVHTKGLGSSLCSLR
jgi:ABC-type uncharacterized transport system substrate-binding protein